MCHPFFDELRDPNTKLPDSRNVNGPVRDLPALFDFSIHGSLDLFTLIPFPKCPCIDLNILFRTVCRSWIEWTAGPASRPYCPCGSRNRSQHLCANEKRGHDGEVGLMNFTALSLFQFSGFVEIAWWIANSVKYRWFTNRHMGNWVVLSFRFFLWRRGGSCWWWWIMEFQGAGVAAGSICSWESVCGPGCWITVLPFTPTCHFPFFFLKSSFWGGYSRLIGPCLLFYGEGFRGLFFKASSGTGVFLHFGSRRYGGLRKKNKNGWNALHGAKEKWLRNQKK